MPFKSKKQRKWMHANRPKMAKKWEKEAAKRKRKKPLKKKRKKKPVKRGIDWSKR
tara:strand:+ start:372 stop:536 length:165 start_codon:yes stop_codon:yes gene_type:complete